jgi:2'-hydroxyisoflavone reductase
MNILVLGGTQFVGRAIVNELLTKGHQVSLFHRGKTGAGLFPECTHILGDRTEDIEKATTQTWDAVIDVSCYFPGQAEAATQLKAKRYVFISTISVYDLSNQIGPLSESAPLLAPQEGSEVTGANYGPMKVRCEDILSEAFGDDLTIIRPGIIFGPNDHTWRFPYWVSRLDACDNLIVPDQLDQPIQGIDAGDLAAFTVKCAVEQVSGVFNAVGPRITFGKMLETIRGLLNHDHRMVMASLDQLESIGLKPWFDLPLIYKTDDRWVTFNFDPAHAQEHGLQLRSFEETAKATLDWVRNTPAEAQGKYGMSRDRELEAMQQLRNA